MAAGYFRSLVFVPIRVLQTIMPVSLLHAIFSVENTNRIENKKDSQCTSERIAKLLGAIFDNFIAKFWLRGQLDDYVACGIYCSDGIAPIKLALVANTKSPPTKIPVIATISVDAPSEIVNVEIMDEIGRAHV